MESLQDTVGAVLNIERMGGGLLARDTYTLVVFNMNFVSQKMIDVILEQHPLVDVSMQSSETSTSGFVVIFTRASSSPVYVSSAFFQVMLAGLVLLSTTSVCAGTGPWVW